MLVYITRYDQLLKNNRYILAGVDAYLIIIVDLLLIDHTNPSNQWRS